MACGRNTCGSLPETCWPDSGRGQLDGAENGVAQVGGVDLLDPDPGAELLARVDHADLGDRRGPGLAGGPWRDLGGERADGLGTRGALSAAALSGRGVVRHGLWRDVDVRG